jgi:SpoIIAA-like
MHLSGKLTGDDVKKYKNVFDQKLANHKHIGICVDLTGLSDMSAEAMIEDVKAEFELFTHLNQLSRCAVVSDKEWPQAVINLMKPLFPTFEMKGFTPNQCAEAIGWAALAEAPKTVPPALRFFPTSKHDVLAFEINGVISSQEMPSIIKEFETFLERHEKVRLLNRIKHFGGIDPAVFMQSGLISMKLAAMQKVERYAVVGAPGWMRKIIETVNPAFPDLDMRTFSADEEADAWVWIGAEPSE